MPTDKSLLRWYKQGFVDEINGSYHESSALKFNHDLEYKAYHLGAKHSFVSEEIKELRNLKDNEILYLIKK